MHSVRMVIKTARKWVNEKKKHWETAAVLHEAHQHPGTVAKKPASYHSVYLGF